MANINKEFIIQEKCWNIMQQFAGLAYDEDKNEISGLLCVKKSEHPVTNEPVYLLFDPVILEQENTGTTTELDGDAIRDYTIKAGMKYGKDIKFCWWHSHHTMGAFWSGTDEKEIAAWKNDTWSIALVVNLKQEYKLNISVWDPVEYSEDVPLEIIRPVPKPTVKQKKQYEELCSTANPIVRPSAWSHSKNGWVSYSKNTNQTSFLIESPKDTALTWKDGDDMEPYARLIEELDTEIEELINSAILGEINYEVYSKQVDKMNKILKKQNAKVKVVKIAKGKLLEKAACMQTWEHLEYENDKIEKVYDEARVTQYNTGYNMGGFLC